MIGMSDDEWGEFKKGGAKGSVIDQALAAEGVTGRAADFVRSIYQQESSSGANTSTSNRGAKGGMQILDGTFNGVADKGWDINDPLQNARAGIRYAMQGWKASNGDPALAGAYYYGGPGGLAKAKAGVAVSDSKNPKAPNTLQYGQQVAARMPSQTESAVRGAVQGATAGWSDEAVGAGGAVGGAINKTGVKPATVGTSVPVLGPILSAMMVLAGSKSKDESIGDTYARLRDSERKANADAKDANPGTYTTTQILGTLLPAALLKSPTALGAVAGAGNSDASTVGGLAKDTAVGGAVGAATAGLSNLAGAGVKNLGDKMGNDAIDGMIAATGKAPGIFKGAASGAGAGAATGAGIALSSGQIDKVPEYAVNGALSGAALGASTVGRNAVTNKIASEVYKRTGDANMGSALMNGGVGNAARTGASALAANVGSSEPAREAGSDVLSWVKNVLGMDTPAGQQNLPNSYRQQQESHAQAVREGEADGQPSPDVPNIIKEGGNEYLITPSGKRVQLN